MIDNFKETFKEEAHELLGTLEISLLELEENPANLALLDDVFRAMHTIKGSSAMFGFDNISSFTHRVEDVYDRLRNGELSLTKELVDLTFQVKDHIRILLEEDDNPEIRENTQRLASAFECFSSTESAVINTPSDSEAEDSIKAKPSTSLITYRIRFKPQKEIFLHGTDPATLLRELSELGDHITRAHIKDIPPIDELDPELCYLWWDIILTTAQGENAITDVFIFVEDKSEISIDIIDEDDIFDSEMDYKRLGEILIDRGDISVEELKTFLKDKVLLGEMLGDADIVESEEVESALAEQGYMRRLKENRQRSVQESSIRVNSEKLDIGRPGW